MRDSLPKKIGKMECGIVNLDNSQNQGTHWVAYANNDEGAYYFDSFGDLRPPKEIIKYLNNDKIYYNYVRFQKFNTVNCGHLSLLFLKKFWKK